MIPYRPDAGRWTVDVFCPTCHRSLSTGQRMTATEYRRAMSDPGRKPDPNINVNLPPDASEGDDDDDDQADDDDDPTTQVTVET